MEGLETAQSQRPEGSIAGWIRLALETMAIAYVAAAFLFLINPDALILFTNTAFSKYGWPMVFFPTERFWFALAFSVPATRAFLAFTASRRPREARLCIRALQISLVVAGLMFFYLFVLHEQAPLYALGCVFELVQAGFYCFLARRLP
jgi:hypothetical protein